MSRSNRRTRAEPNPYRPTRPPQPTRRYRSAVLADPGSAFALRSWARPTPTNLATAIVPDARRWTFTTHPLAQAFRDGPRVTASVTPKQVKGRYRDVTVKTIGARIGFKAPQSVAECLRRKARREVLLALGKANGRAPKRLTALSHISC